MVSFLRTDSPLSRSIVTSFLQFLNTVETTPGQDTEGIEVAAQCLIEVFGIENHAPDEQTRGISLIDLFSSAGQAPGVPSAHGNERVPTRPVGETSQSRAAPSVMENGGEDCLQDKFKDGLELAGFFDGTVIGTPAYEQKLKLAKAVVDEARKKVRSTTPAPSWSKSYSEDTLVLAEAFKIQGNKTMNSNQYHAAIQLYTLAISLCSNNAIFYSNRAAALTAIGKLEEAIGDCHAAMELDPLYSKAYSRLGSVYYAQGKFEDSIEKGYKKALELDPTSTSSQENLRAAQQKLEEQQRQGEREPQQGSPPQGAGDANASPSNLFFPPDITNLLPGLINMASQIGQRAAQSTQQHAGQGQGPGGVGNDNGAHQGEPEVTMDSTFNVTLNGQEIPSQYASLMQNAFQQMFGGSSGWPPGSSPNSQQQQGPPGGS